MKNILFVVFIFCVFFSQNAFSAVSNTKVDTANFKIKNRAFTTTMSLVTVNDSIPKTDSIATKNRNHKKSKAHKAGLAAFGLMGAAYVIYIILGLVAASLGWVLLPYMFIGLAILGLIAIGLSIRSLLLYRKQKDKKGVFWSFLAFFLGLLPLAMLALVIFALSNFK